MSQIWTKKDTWDVDTNRQSDGWQCHLYHNNQLVTSTKSVPTKKQAQKEMVDEIGKLTGDKRPPFFNNKLDVIWNADHDFTNATSNLTNDKWKEDKWWEKNKGKNSSGSWTGSQYGTYQHCDHSPTDKESLVYKIGSVEIIGATKSCIKAEQKESRLIVNCSGYKLNEEKVKNPFLSIPKTLSFIGKTDYTHEPASYGDELLVDWKDQGPAPVVAQFWVDFLSEIKDPKFPYKQVIFCCMGGHGRTGTALASLAMVAHIYDESPVEFPKQPDRVATMAERAECWVQATYCEKAIESNAQVKYLEYVEAFLKGSK